MNTNVTNICFMIFKLMIFFKQLSDRFLENINLVGTSRSTQPATFG